MSGSRREGGKLAPPRKSESAAVTGSRPPGGDPPLAATPRDAYFDNAKFFAVVLVVCGHVWGPLADSADNRLVRAAYLTVYTFHMPLFVMVCGFFSRSFADNPVGKRRFQRLVTSTLVPYVIFATAYGLMRSYKADEWVPIDFLEPWYLTWFLIALFLWRITSPLWRVVKAPLVVACAAALAIGTTETSGDLALGQFFQYLPFFVLGLVVRRAHVDRIRAPGRLRWGAAAVFPAAFLLVYAMAPTTNAEWLYRRTGHENLDVSLVRWWGTSIVIAGAALLLSACFLALVPSRPGPLSRFGEKSQYVYLLHGLVVQMALAHGWYDKSVLEGLRGLALTTLVGVGLAVVLATGPVRWCAHWAIEPRMDWAFRRVSPSPPRGSRTNENKPG
ncbi:acyltransferase family protein [Yinghuangia sp. YIM S09857]|uniref:acyltransferase family protein n=1 Tax=Yinghuangia sp. YIM S09857 TaxID=3436929 RepID=UPI003F52F54A